MLDFLGYALLLAMLAAYLTRTTAIRRVRPVGIDEHTLDAREERFNVYFGLPTSTQVVGGNRIGGLFNSDRIFPRLREALKEARHAICVHVYAFQPGRVADELLRILSERAQAGVTVFVLLDAVGGGKLSRDYRERLTAAGAGVAIYRPLRFREIYNYQQRMHICAPS
ncbi:MAG: hypothetical protein K9L70_07315 [Thiohalocapsa sp.]|nr:hypothetical protein [Thiohalocapsa sp.]MCF7989191.1 hypothetical protein [Thiohalocapsa sp.]